MSQGFKSCPHCGKLIMADATVCKHCGKDIYSVKDIAGNKPVSSDSVLAAFTYMFKDKHFIQKALPVMLLFLLSYIIMPAKEELKSNFFDMTLVSRFICGFLFILLPIMGHSCNCVSELAHNRPIPCVNLPANFLTGLMFFLTILTVFIPAILIAIGSLVGIISKMSLLLIGLALIGIIIYPIFLPSIIWIFANTGNILSGYRWLLIKNIIIDSFGRYVASLLLFVGFSVVFTIFAFLAVMLLGLFNNLGVIVVVCSVFATYNFFVVAHIYAKCIAHVCLDYVDYC